MKILKSQLRKAINEQVQAFFVTPPSMGMVGVRRNAKGGANQLEEDDIDKDFRMSSKGKIYALNESNKYDYNDTINRIIDLLIT